MSTPCCPLSSHFECTRLSRRPRLAIMCKHDVIHKTGNTKCIATPPDEDRATDVANVHKKFGEDRTCSSGHVLADRETDRQTDRHGHHNTPLADRRRRRSSNSRHCYAGTHTHGPFPGTTQVNRYQKGKTNLDFTEATDSEWQWHQLCRMQVCTSLQTDNHASTPPLSFLQAGCPSCCPTNSVKALKATQAVEQYRLSGQS